MGGGLRCTELRSQAGINLLNIARASSADALSIVNATGVLACIEARLLVAAGGRCVNVGLPLRDAERAASLLSGLLECGGPRVAERVGREGALLSTLAWLMMGGPIGGATSLPFNVAAALSSLSGTLDARVDAVAALSLRELQDASDGFANGKWEPSLSCIVSSALVSCGGRYDRGFCERLLSAGLAKALVALTTQLSGDEEDLALASNALGMLIKAAQAFDLPGQCASFQQLVKPLVAALDDGAALGASPRAIAIAREATFALSSLSNDPRLFPSLASGLPTLVSFLKGGSGPLVLPALVFIGNFGSEPGAQLAIRAGAVSALMALVRSGGADGHEARHALSNFVSDEGLRAIRGDASFVALLATPLALGLYQDLRPPTGRAAFSRDVSTLLVFVKAGVLTVGALLASRAVRRLMEIARGHFGGAPAADAARALIVMACAPTLPLPHFDALAASGALRAAFDAFVDPKLGSYLALPAAWDIADTLDRPGDLRGGNNGVSEKMGDLLVRNPDVIVRLFDLASAGSGGAGDDSAAGHASRALSSLSDPAAVGPEVAGRAMRLVAESYFLRR